MFTCPSCNGSKERYVEWANDYAPCNVCKATGQVGKRIHRKYQRRYKVSRGVVGSGYQIQSQRPHYNDYDAVCSIEWNTVRIVQTVSYGLALVRRMNEREMLYCDFVPYRLVSPNGHVVRSNGNEGETAYHTESYGY